MQIKSITIEIRTPTVQYGYRNTRYEVELDESAGDTIESVIRHVGMEHYEAEAMLDDDIAERQRSEELEKWDVIPM